MDNVETPDLIRFARIPLELNVKPGEEVLIFTDTTTEEAIPKAVAAAAREIGAEPSIVIVSTSPAPNLEPPRAAAAAMKNTDVLVVMGSQPIMHTEAMRAALGAGIKLISMSGITVDTMTHGAVTADPHELYAVTERVARLLTEASTARVTSETGTDVTMDLRGRAALVLGASVFQARTPEASHTASPLSPRWKAASRASSSSTPA